MGSGPATYVASKRQPGALLLMSAFKSIRAVAADQAGSILKYLIQDRFQNIDKIKNVKSPTFLVHGMQDTLINCQHSKDLHDNCGGPCCLLMPTRMDHNDFDFYEDLITPFFHFMKQCGMSTREPREAFNQMKIPSSYFRIPHAYKQKSIPVSWACCYQGGYNPMLQNNALDSESDEDQDNYDYFASRHSSVMERQNGRSSANYYFNHDLGRDQSPTEIYFAQIAAKKQKRNKLSKMQKHLRRDTPAASEPSDTAFSKRRMSNKKFDNLTSNGPAPEDDYSAGGRSSNLQKNKDYGNKLISGNDPASLYSKMKLSPKKGGTFKTRQASIAETPESS